jgi:type IV pilus assembly protein PilX
LTIKLSIMLSNTHYKFARTEQGAALIVGLLLLLVLTILGISGMNTASLEFIMAGNEQFKNNAFQAAETGIQSVAVASNNFVASDTAPPTTTTGNAISGSADTYDATVVFVGKGNTLAGNSTGTSGAATQFAGYYFTITGTGRSARGAQATNVQGIGLNRLNDPSVTRDPGNTNTAWTPPP